ncbi:MAG: uroporphyrinogen-III C-methyltransferase, partial [Proteobacteria bacterium]|nr:uroporphyrinogen-III C-methyltransferase [Pseudomonadota bacterium]
MSDKRAGRAGRVVLVGAGPGDPGLLTLRGAAALRECDAVLYDELASTELLDLAPPEAERINVGKRGHDAPTRCQDDINKLLIDLARDGRIVVRLKGGDPFVFGRGGEEASVLEREGIPFEIVPGVSSALAAPAAAGIPVTDRRHSASFAVVTGHKDPTRVSRETRWAELGSAVDTLIILMGMRNLGEIVGHLLDGGKDPSTPAAAVMNATLPNQRVVEAPLAELPERVAAAGLGAPAAVVIGDVVQLRSSLGWWEQLPLFGIRVLVTRSADQAGELIDRLRRAGAEPVRVPLLRHEPPEDEAPLAGALAAARDYDAIVFASVNAVRFTARAAERAGVALDSPPPRLLCVGPATARAALDAGIGIHGVASGKSGGGAGALLEELGAFLPIEGSRFLVPRSEIGRDELAAGLRAAGARVDEVVAYRNLPPDVDAAALSRQIAAGEIPIVTVMSPSAATRLVALLDAD